MSFFKDPIIELANAEEYLSGNVRLKLREANVRRTRPSFQVNVEALEAAQPKRRNASEIEFASVRRGLIRRNIQQFMEENHQHAAIFAAPSKSSTRYTAECWQVSNKDPSHKRRCRLYHYGPIGQRVQDSETAKPRDIRIYDTVEDPDGKERRDLNSNETPRSTEQQASVTF